MNHVSKIIVAALVTTGIIGSPLAFAANQKTDNTPLASNLTIEQVSEIALKALSGTIEEISLERKDCNTVFEVEIKTKKGEMEVLIDASSGEVLAMEADNDGHDHDDDDDDDDDDDGENDRD